MSYADEVLRRAAALHYVPYERLQAVVLTTQEQRGDYSREERLQVARHLLWNSGDHARGVEPGGFISTMLLAWGRADNLNSQRLALAFPAYADAIDTLRMEGPDALLEWATKG